jgi:hypothetical protein
MLRWNDMKNGILIAVLLLALTPAVFAQELYERPCGTGVDLCAWDKTLPLGSPDGPYGTNGAFCGLSYNTLWSVNTTTSATCTFDGTNLQNTKLYISIDNDVINCTLNGVMVPSSNITHEYCAPADPRNGSGVPNTGYNISLTPASGANTLVCHVRDRGVMSHFDACVVGQQSTPAPEFPSIAVPFIVAIGAATFVYTLRKMS